MWASYVNNSNRNMSSPLSIQFGDPDFRAIVAYAEQDKCNCFLKSIGKKVPLFNCENEIVLKCVITFFIACCLNQNPGQRFIRQL